jgi:hypothetical protein
MRQSEGDWRAFSQNLLIRSVLWFALRLPYETRVRLMGWNAVCRTMRAAR